MAEKPTNPNDRAELQRQIAELTAQLAAAQRADLSGSGAVAQGGGDALGERAAKVADNYGTIVTGTQIVTHYATTAGGLTKQQIAAQVACYLRWLCARTETIPLRGIERAGGPPVILLPLVKAYVPLRALSSARLGDQANALETPHRRARGGGDGDQDTLQTLGQLFAEDRAGETGGDREIALDQALGLGNRLVIIGGPGCGKTTVLLHMAWALASSLRNGQPEPAQGRLGLTLAPAELPLPIFVPLASFARHRRGLPPSAPARHGTLAHFISHHLISKQADFDLPADFFVQLLNDGRNVLLLLDGLDEVANDHERAEVRQSVDELVAGRPGMRVVVTCRTIAYRRGRTALEGDFRQITVQTLDLDQHVAPMVRQAYACIHPRDAVRQAERAEGLLDGIRRLEQQRRERMGDRAETLVNSPLMVRLLLIVNENNRTLPDERADLFDKAINALLQVDYGLDEQVNTELSADWKDHREMSQHLAFQMHQQGADQGREIEESALRKALEQEPDFLPRIDGFLAQAHRRGSVLEERNGVYRFIHLAFQEFLVARYLREVVGGAGREAILGFLDHRLDDPWWREPILLLAGYLAANSAKPARDFLTALARAGKTPNARFSAAELAGTAALEWRQRGESMRSACARQILSLLDDQDAMAGSEPTVRALACDVLAALGDPRFDPDRFYLPDDDWLGFVEIPADPQFLIGTRRADAERVGQIIGGSVDKHEINDAPTPTPAFYIARFLVTVAQFRAFVDANGNEPGDRHAPRDADNRPVRGVTWHEALRYCVWLNDTLRTDPDLADTEPARLVREKGWQVTLPSELEWEKAARGTLAAAVFPWGHDPDPNRSNYRASEIGDTSAVGCFPANGFGLYDMTGNVFEWTRSLWGKDWDKPDFVYPYSADDSKREALGAGDDVVRVVRGGSWNYTEFIARCAFRRRHHPGFQFAYLGFRVLLRAAPVA